MLQSTEAFAFCEPGSRSHCFALCQNACAFSRLLTIFKAFEIVLLPLQKITSTGANRAFFWL